MVDKKHRAELEALIPAAKRLARILANDPAQAEDMAQDALLAVWGKLDSGGEIENLRPYLMTVLRNRRNRRTWRAPPALPLDEIAPPPDIDRTTPYLAMAEVRAAIDRLPPDQAMLLKGCAAGLSYRELAAASEVPLGTIMSRVSRARGQLRTDMALARTGSVCDSLCEA